MTDLKGCYWLLLASSNMPITQLLQWVMEAYTFSPLSILARARRYRGGAGVAAKIIFIFVSQPIANRMEVKSM